MGNQRSQVGPLETGQALALEHALSAGFRSRMNRTTVQRWIGAAVTKEAVAQLLQLDPAEALLRLQCKPAASQMPVWVALQMGQYQTGKELEQALHSATFSLDPGASAVLSGMITLHRLPYVQLVLVRVDMLGFPKGTTLGPFYNKACGLGLVPCPKETPFYLGLQAKDIVIGDITVATEPQPVAKNARFVILSLSPLSLITRSSDAWLRPDEKWVFRIGTS